MSVGTEPAVSLKGPGAIPDDYIYRLTVEQYHQMIRADILTNDTPVELLEGWLVVRMKKNPPHRLATGLIRRALEICLPAGWFIDSHQPVTTEDSEPEPDVSVVRGELRQYGDHHPGPQHCALVVEVTDALLRRDRITKKRIYARAAVPFYWIINLIDGHIEVYTDPTGPADKPDYRQRQDYGPDSQVPVVLDGREIARLNVCDLLP